MSDATLAVHFAGALVTLQDGGRLGHLRYGVAASGPMDRVAFAAANAALGNVANKTAIEVSLGGLIVECKSGALTLAIAGGDFMIEHAGAKTNGWTVLTLREGERLSVRVGSAGSWAYIAFAGDVVAKEWLGQTATHSTTGFGGGAIQTGQQLVVEHADIREDREGLIEQPDFLPGGVRIRVVMGPQDMWFRTEAIAVFKNTRYKLTNNYDRMGVRLEGEHLALDAALSIPSEPIVRGSVQVTGEGVPTVLLADHHTTGGYPKIATVISTDINVLVQKRSGQEISFEAIPSEVAVKIARQFAQDVACYLAKVSIPRGNLQQRLMQQNLISGAVGLDD
ncbi:MAG: biotin-dependent carboxyltransferase family protein [Granulosicoccaceae bacterium]